MPVSDERLSGKIQRVRERELPAARRRLGPSLSDNAFTDEGVRTLAEDLNEAALQGVWAHPAYATVAQRLAELGVPTVADKGVISHALRDGFRMVSGMLALYLHATPGGLTYSRLLALAELGGRAGHGRTHALIAYMRFLGYIEPGQGAADGRERRYEPTRRMREAFRNWFLDHLEAIAPLRPEADETRRLIEQDDSQFDTFMARVGEGMILAGMVVREHSPGPNISLFTERRSGAAILWRLLLSAPDGTGWPASEAFPLSVADLARRCGVSRSHVQRLLKDAEAAGMIALDRTGSVRLLPALHQEVHTLLGILIISIGGCARNLLEDRTRAAAAG